MTTVAGEDAPPRARTRSARSRQRASTEGTAPAIAEVTLCGAIEPVDEPGGARLLSEHPLLVQQAVALLESNRDRLRFVFVPAGSPWIAVDLSVLEGHDGLMRVRALLRPIAPPSGLTVRELDVLTLVASGYSNQGIAELLATSLRTVTTHVERILAKFGQASRAALAGIAAESGLLRLPLPGGARARSPLTVDPDHRPSHKGAAGRRRSASPPPVLIGAPLSLNGFSSADAHEMLNGARLAVAEVNQRGGVGGRRLELVVAECDVNDAASVEAAIANLIDVDVDAVAGGYSCAEARVQDLMADHGAPYLHCVTMEAMVERVRQDPQRLRNIFQTGPTDIHYGPQCVSFLSDLRDRGAWRPRNRRLVVLQPSWSMMDIGLGTMEERADRTGWSIEHITGLPLTGTDWSAILGRIARIDPAAILLANYFPEESIAFQRAFLADPLDSLVYTLYGPSVPLYRETLGADADGVIWATSTGTYADPIALGFAERYRALHGALPGRAHAGLSYDRIHLLCSAWARAGGTRRFDEVAREIRQLVHRGVSGTYALGNSGQCGVSYPDATRDPSFAQAHLVFQIQGGRHAILGPHPYADGAFRLPPWFEA